MIFVIVSHDRYEPSFTLVKAFKTQELATNYIVDLTQDPNRPGWAEISEGFWLNEESGWVYEIKPVEVHNG